MALHSGRHFSAGERKFDQVISINGSRPNQNMFLRDGGINSEPAFTGPGYLPSVDLVDQYKVQTSNFSAEFSHTGGGLVNVITKSGGNTLHGSAWEFFRNTNLVANDVFSNRAGLPRAQFRFNQFGERREGPSAATRHFSLPPTRGFAGYRAGPQWDSSTVAPSQLLRPFPQFTGVTTGSASFFCASSYNAMQLKVEKRYSHGFNLLLAYTWSNLMDNIPASETGFPGGSFGGTGIQDWDNLRAEWEVASFDTPQYLAINGIYALPFGHGRRFFNHSRAADYIIGGWQLTGITSAESGTPQEVFAASNTLFKWPIS